MKHHKGVRNTRVFPTEETCSVCGASRQWWGQEASPWMQFSMADRSHRQPLCKGETNITSDRLAKALDSLIL